MGLIYLASSVWGRKESEPRTGLERGLAGGLRHVRFRVVIAERREQLGHPRVLHPPQPGDQLRLRVRREIGQQFGHDILRGGLFQQAGAEVDEQPGAVITAEAGVLAVLAQPDRSVRAQNGIGQRPPDGGHGRRPDPVHHRERGTAQSG